MDQRRWACAPRFAPTTIQVSQLASLFMHNPHELVDIDFRFVRLSVPVHLAVLQYMKESLRANLFSETKLTCESCEVVLSKKV